jgi:hypothetical protein
MTRFIHWRKMTWAIAAWSVAMLAWMIGVLVTGGAADCGTDFGSSSTFLTKQACIDASSGHLWKAFALIPSLWLLGLVALSVTWFMTRPLWRHGHGFRFRRLRSVETPWIERNVR